MLQSLQVKNFAIIDEVDINFDEAMTALTGETGAGKTTLVSLLVRLYDPSKGKVKLDGHDLREISFESISS